MLPESRSTTTMMTTTTGRGAAANDLINARWGLSPIDVRLSSPRTTGRSSATEFNPLIMSMPSTTRRTGRQLTLKKPLKGILKSPSTTNVTTIENTRIKNIRRANTGGMLDLPGSTKNNKKTKKQQRRTVSFSDNMCRWKNNSQGSSLTLNRMPSRSRDKLNTMMNNAVPPSRTSSGGQGNHVWDTTTARRSSPPSQPRRTTTRDVGTDSPSSSALRRPKRRGSNEFQEQQQQQQPNVIHNKSDNVFQSSVNSFLMNARAPTRTPSSSKAA